jgi:outer membrane lipopolysaccharide assembly protein LptE/RlpB
MERWFIVGFMAAIFMVLAAAGWHFHQTSQVDTGICASADAHCGERHL